MTVLRVQMAIAAALQAHRPSIVYIQFCMYIDPSHI
jgi:hypothetical protein